MKLFQYFYFLLARKETKKIISIKKNQNANKHQQTNDYKSVAVFGVNFKKSSR